MCLVLSRSVRHFDIALPRKFTNHDDLALTVCYLFSFFRNPVRSQPPHPPHPPLLREGVGSSKVDGRNGLWNCILSLLSHFRLIYALPKKIKLISNCETFLIERGLEATIAFLGCCVRLAFWENAIRRNEGISGCSCQWSFVRNCPLYPNLRWGRSQPLLFHISGL